MGKKKNPSREKVPGIVYSRRGPYRILEDGSVWVPSDPYWPATYAPGTAGHAYFTGQHDDEDDDE